MTWLEHNTPARLRWLSECRTYAITASCPSDGIEPWWEARHSSGREIAAGYGDAGLAKCQQFCQRDADRSVAEPIEQAPVEPTRVEIHAPSSNNVPQSPAQSALF